MSKALILEDNLQQGQILKEVIEENGYEVMIAPSIAEALLIIESNEIEIFFLDIDLPDGDGMDFAKSLRRDVQYEFTWIVFLTKHTSYIFDAIRKVNCHDYIIKPYDKEDIEKILNKFTRKKKHNESEKISFKSGNLIVRLSPEKIIMVEVIKKNTYIFTEDNVYEIKRVTLKTINNKLSKYRYFVKCHRSYIVNLNYIKEIKKEFSGLTIFMECIDKKVPIGEKFKNHIITKLKT